MQATLRRGICVLCALLGIGLFAGGVCPAAFAESSLDKVIAVDIPAQSLTGALIQLSKQSGAQILMSADLVADRKTNGIHGHMSIRDALSELLRGTALGFHAAGENTIGIDAAPGVSQQRSEAAQDGPLLAVAGEVAGTDAGNADGGPSNAGSRSSAGSRRADDESTQLSTVTVTATKRDVDERKVAGAVTAMTGAQLRAMGAQGYGDYLALVPGVQLDGVANPGQSYISIRGVTTTTAAGSGATVVQNPVGIYYDEIPLTDSFGTVSIPDFDPFDVDRIEVLRGPQGALFGSGSLGGAINYVPNRPKLDAFESELEVSSNFGRDSKVGGYGKGMFNLPIVHDRLGLRASAYAIETPGYIDNVGIGRKDSNNTQRVGGRAAMLWAPLSGTTVELGGLYDVAHIADTAYELQQLGGYQKDSRIAEPYRNKLGIGYLRLNSELGFAKLFANASYQLKTYAFNIDASYLFNPLFTDIIGTVASPGSSNAHAVTGELRLVSPEHVSLSWLPGDFDWLVGAFRSSRSQRLFDSISGQDLNPSPSVIDPFEQALGPVFGPIYGAALGSLPAGTMLAISNVTNDAHVQETAMYGEIGYRFLPHWKLSLGGRGFRNAENNGELTSGALSATATAGGSERDYGFNPKLSLSYSPNDNALYYALYSRGYSLGGINIPISGVVPPTYGPNKLYNYEAGLKTAWLDRRLFVDVTPYYIYWQAIPLVVFNGSGSSYLANVGSAHTDGIETSVSARPIRGLTINGTATWAVSSLNNAYNSAQSTAVNPISAILEPNQLPVVALVPAGAALPGTSRWQFGNVNTYVWPWRDGTYRLTLINQYSTSAPTSIQYENYRKGGYFESSVRAGYSWNNLSVQLFVNNLTGSHGITNSAPSTTTRTVLNIVPPRMFGVTFGCNFP